MAKKIEEEQPLSERIIKQTELAAIVGKTPRWIRQMTSEGILKQVSRGKYVLSDAVQAYIEHAEGGRQEDNRPRLKDEQTELTRIKKEIADLELSQLRGELHKGEDVEKFVSNMILAVKVKLQAIPTRLAPQLENESTSVIEAAIRREINAALKGLASYDPTGASDG